MFQILDFTIVIDYSCKFRRIIRARSSLFEDKFDISKELVNISFFKFTNKIMGKVELPRVLEEMRKKL